MGYEIFKGAIAWAIAILAGLASAMALISAMVFLLDVGLEDFLLKLVGYYQEFFEPLYKLIALLGFPVPRIWVDLLVVYTVGVGINFRLFYGIAHVQNLVGTPQEHRTSQFAIAVPYNLYLIKWLLKVRRSFEIANRHMPLDSSLKVPYTSEFLLISQTLLSAALVPLATLLFFVYNAFKVSG